MNAKAMVAVDPAAWWGHATSQTDRRASTVVNGTSGGRTARCGMVNDLMHPRIGHGKMVLKQRTISMTPEQATRLGAFIAERRTAAGLSQRKLAEAIGVQNTTVMRLENGDLQAPGPDHLAAIAAELDIELADMFALADYVVPKQLPSLKPYLRSRYDLPDGATEQIEQYARRLAKRHGVDLNGPAPGEDEQPPRTTKPNKKGGRT